MFQMMVPSGKKSIDAMMVVTTSWNRSLSLDALSHIKCSGFAMLVLIVREGVISISKRLKSSEVFLTRTEGGWRPVPKKASSNSDPVSSIPCVWKGEGFLVEQANRT